jgi:streptogramin lyase
MCKSLLLTTIALCSCLTAAAWGGPVPEIGNNRNSFITEFDFSHEHAGPSVVQSDSDGNVWVALARAGKIVRFQADGQKREFSLPTGSFPVGIARDKADHLYVSDIRRNAIVQVNVNSGATKDYPVPTANAWPFFLSMSSNGHVWFSERVGNKIGELDPISGALREYAVPTEQAQPAGLVVTPDDHIYFSENTGHKIGCLDSKVGKVVELKVPSTLQTSPYYGLAGITADQSGNVWFAELDGRLGFIERRPGAPDKIREIALPSTGLRPAGVAVDQWGIIWFTELDGNAIGSYNPKLGVFDHFAIPTGSPDPVPMGPPEATARGEMPVVGLRARTSRPFGIAVDKGGRIWFSEQYAGKVGRLDVPVVRVFAPNGRATSVSTPVTVQVRSSSSTPVLKFELNGIPLGAGSAIDLSRAPGGANQLRVAVVGEETSSATTSFIYDPNIDAIREALSRQTTAASANSTVTMVLKHLREASLAEHSGHPEQARNIEQELIRKLSSGGLPSANLDVVLSQLRWKDRFGSHDHVVTLAGASGKPAPIVVEVGDSVEWKQAGASAAHGLEISACNAESEALPHSMPTLTTITFHRSGDFNYALHPESPCVGEVKVVPRTLAIEEFPLPDKDSVPGVLSVDPQGNVWFTEGGGGYSKLAAVPLNNKIGCLKPDGTIRQYPTPTLESAPTSIHVGAEGHVWFTERAGNNLGELIPETGQIIEYPIPTANSGTTGITVDHQGTIWFASKGSSKIGYLDPKTKKMVEITTPTPKSQPSTITIDGDDNVWFDERAQDKIVRYETRTEKMTEFDVPTQGSRVVGLVPDRQGNLYFLELGANKVGHLDVSSGQITEYAIPTAFSSPFKETLDNEGRLWFTEVFGNKIGMLQNGAFTEYAIPTKDAMPGGITMDMRGNIWFSEQAGNKIAMIPSVLSIARFAVYGDHEREHQHHHNNQEN